MFIRHIVAGLCVIVPLVTFSSITVSGAQSMVTQFGPALTVLTPEEERAKTAKPGSEFMECASGCPAMIVLPTGKFVMGSSERELDRRPAEGPQHEVTISAPLAVSKFEVTFAEWDACVTASACPSATDAWGRGDMPVINVSWDDARQYAGWLSRTTGKPYRLLTEAEWEYAARAGSAKRYSWGDDPGTNTANCVDCNSKWTLQTAPVGSFKPNAWDLYDFSGNVWEWVEDSWHGNYDDAPDDGSAWISDDPDYRVIRGGSWHNESALIRPALRVERNRHVQFDTLGFRVARTMKP